VREPKNLRALFEELNFADIERIEIRNQTTGGEANYQTQNADGTFSALVPVQEGKNKLEVIAHSTDGSTASAYVTVRYLSGADAPVLPPRLMAQRNRLLERHLADLRRRSLEIYSRGAEYSAAHGIILADTKFEFGIVDGEIILIDEVLTPDSSRYWPADAWAPNATMPSFDKQPVRDWLEAADWDKTPPAPELPDEVVTDTRRRYIDVYERLTGHSFAEYLRELGALDPTE